MEEWAETQTEYIVTDYILEGEEIKHWKPTITHSQVENPSDADGNI